MANKQLQGWINQQIGDISGANQEFPIKDLDNLKLRPKKADWCYTFSNGSAIIIEGKESGDTGLREAEHQLSIYEKLLRKQKFSDILTIAVKDDGTAKTVKTWRNGKLCQELDSLKNISWYMNLLGARKDIDISSEIFRITTCINELLHHEFKISNLVDRMVFTGCILVASCFTNGKISTNNYDGINGFKTIIKNKITDKFSKPEIKAKKIENLTTYFGNVDIPKGSNLKKSHIDTLVDYANKLVDIIQQNPKSNIDIMNIFFTEFNRYRSKPENGQVFTPDHISTLMAKILQISVDDHILDPTCGSGSLLVKSANENNNNWNNIYGNDYFIDVLRLSYVNMLLHHDGITNLYQRDATDISTKSDKEIEQTFAQWVKNSKITKVIANPPYENSLPKDILMNLIENVEDGCKFVWLMPNNKLDKLFKGKYEFPTERKVIKTFKNGEKKEVIQKNIDIKKYFFSQNSLTDIIMLGDIFPKIGCGDVSIFVFKKGVPQGNNLIRGWTIDDGFVTVKNQGYQDVNGNWPNIEKRFLNCFFNEMNDFSDEDKKLFKFKLIDFNERLSYPKEIVIKPVTKADFEITLLQNQLFDLMENTEKIRTQEEEILLKFMEVNKLEDKLDFCKNALKKDEENYA